MSKIIFLALVFACQAWDLEARTAWEDRATDLFSLRATEGCDWNYYDFSFWAKCSFWCGYETNQNKGSPINIDTTDPDLDDSKLWKLTTESGGSSSIKDNKNKWVGGKLIGEWKRKGYTFQFTVSDTVDDNDIPKIKYATEGTITHLTKNIYKLWQVHFHWGKDATEGSEHTVDGTKYPLEVHYVHKNTQICTTDAPCTDKNWLLVIGVLFEGVDAEDTPETNWVKQIANMAKYVALEELKNEGPQSREKNIHWALYRTMITGLENGFYSYKGSLTTPGCNEQVTWVVAKDTVKVYKPNLDGFRMLQHPNTVIDGVDEPQTVRILRNWRPTQDLGDRTVYELSPP